MATRIRVRSGPSPKSIDLRSPAESSSDEPLAQLAEGPIFIVGLARSGTTWVQAIMAAHPLASNVYESTIFDSANGLAELLAPHKWASTRAGLGALLTREQMLEEIRRFVGRVFAQRLYPGHRYLVEKTPGHLWQMPLIAEIFPDARFIHVLRDGRDVHVSTRAAKRGWAKDWKRQGPKLWLPFMARRWNRALARVAADGPALGDRFMEIRYEEMKADPAAAIARLYDFCRMPHDPEFLERVRHDTDFEQNHTPDESAFFRGGRVGDWRTHYNVLDGLIFNLVAGPALVTAGYEKNRRWLAPPRRAVRPRTSRAATAKARRG